MIVFVPGLHSYDLTAPRLKEKGDRQACKGYQIYELGIPNLRIVAAMSGAVNDVSIWISSVRSVVCVLAVLQLPVCTYCENEWQRSVLT